MEGCEVSAQARQRAQEGERPIRRDERTGVQALERTQPDVPMQPGPVLRRAFESIRHGTQTGCLTFDVVTGKVIEPSWGPTRTEEDARAPRKRLVHSDPPVTTWIPLFHGPVSRLLDGPVARIKAFSLSGLV